MRNTLLGEETSPVRCGAMSKIIFVVQRTALSVFQLAGIAHFVHKMKYLTSNLNSQLTRKT